MDFRTLHNTSNVPQSVVFKGQQWIIGPNQEENLDTEVAQKFLEICTPIVLDVTIDKGGGDIYAPDLVKQTIWVANMTGNPESPKTVKVQRHLKDGLRISWVEAPNINHEPRNYSVEAKGGHEQWYDKMGGLWQKSRPNKTLVVPPFKRRPFEYHEGKWLLGTDSNNEQRGAIIESRAPTDFEPEMAWKTADLQVYARLIDPSMDLGVPETEVVRAAQAGKKTDKEITELLRTTKQQLLRRLYFRIVNPRYRLPTRKEFNELVTGKSEEQVAKEEMYGLLETADRDIKNTKQKLASASRAP